MKKLASMILSLMLSLALLGVAVAEDPIELFVSGAASLTDVLTEIGNDYMAANPGVKMVFSFDSSGTLQTQIEEGAPADVFVSAAQKQMNALQEQELILADTRINLLENKVVLIVPADSELDIETFEDVASDKVKMVAIGGESVPVGQYTQQIYEHLGLWDAIMAKANLGENVRAVLAWVESGDVDCGIVYATDAATTEGVKVIAQAPEGSVEPVIYPAAVVADSQHADAAKAFVEYLTSEEAIARFEAAGFAMAE